MKQDALKMVMLRNNFYRDNFRRVTFILLLSVIVNVLLLIGLFWAVHLKPQPIYFATTNTGKLIRLQPLNQPLMNNQSVTSWVSRHVPSIYNLDFVHYKQQLQYSRELFTPYGWNQFIKGFQSVVKNVATNQYVVKGDLAGPPVVVKAGTINGIYTWQVQVPIQVTYQKNGSQSVQKVLWQIIIQRVNNVDKDGYLGISQVIQTAMPENS